MPQPNPNRSQAEQIVTFGARHAGGKPSIPVRPALKSKAGRPRTPNAECRMPNAERLIKPAAAIRILSGLKTKLDLFASDPRGGQGWDSVFTEEFDPGRFHCSPGFATLQPTGDK